jgi:hypothetical protein
MFEKSDLDCKIMGYRKSTANKRAARLANPSIPFENKKFWNENTINPIGRNGEKEAKGIRVK